MLVSLLTLKLLYGAAGDEIHIRGVAREIQVLAAVHNGRTGRTHMNFFCTRVVQKLHGFLQLGAADDGVVHKEELLALNQLGNGDLLHLGYLIAHALIGGGKKL